MRLFALSAAAVVVAVSIGCSSDEGGGNTGAGGGSGIDAGSGGHSSGGGSGGKSSGGSGGLQSGGSGGKPAGDASSGGSGGTAGNDGGDAAPDHASGTGGDGATGGDVVGTVTSTVGTAVANIPVIVNGVTYVTNAQGKFTATGIGATYDATTIFQDFNGMTQAYVFLGLATRTPVIQITTAVPALAATVNGQLSGGAGFPNGTSQRAAVGAIKTGGFLGFVSLGAAEGPGYGPMTLTWGGNASIDATLFALEWSVDANGLPTAYTGWTTKALTISDGGTFGVPDGGTPATNLALTAVSDRALSGTATVPTGLTVATKLVYVGSVGAPARTIHPVGDPTPATTYQYRVPTGLAPIELAFRVSATGTNNRAADTAIRFDDTTPNLDVSLLTVPVPVLPVDGATQIDYGTAFTFTGPPNSVHSVQCWETNGNVTFTIYTMGSSVKIPDLTAAGIPLKRGTGYTWVAAADGPAASVEDVFLQPLNFFKAHGKRSNAFSEERTFTVAP